MEPDGLGLVIGFFILCIGIVLLVLWPIFKWQSIGPIKCKRCKFVGLPKNKCVPFKGDKPVCARCESDDWEVLTPPQ